VLELDILRSNEHDLSKVERQDKLIKRIKAGEFSLVLASPPCDTFSRVKFANNLGPPPVRDAAHPRGLPFLNPYQQKQVDLGSSLVDFYIPVSRSSV
jgi:hypothetical protein